MPYSRKKLYEIIFEADTKAGKTFDVVLLIVIVYSVIIVLLESVKSIDKEFGVFFNISEWLVTGVFLVEYIVRIAVIKRPSKYILSFYGIIDLLSILPSLIGLFIVGTHGLMTIRALRLLRVFRIFKLARYTKEANAIVKALKASRTKIFVFLFGVLMIVVIIGTMMYLIEGEDNGFSNIPVSIYWAIVTLTTVGYGDISPGTPAGQMLASLVMILGYAIIAVPTGIVSVEIAKAKKQITTQVCPNCIKEGHDTDAEYCKYCGYLLNE